MPTVLICSPRDLEPELCHTFLWRDDVERHVAGGLEEALSLALAARPHVVAVDRDLPRAGALISGLRRDPSTRPLSIVILARGDMGPGEVELLEAGANAILRLPASAEWDDRLVKLIQVPLRREGRFPVHFEVEARAPMAPEPGLALALNLSRHGMLIECSSPLAVGDDLHFSFRLPGPDGAVTGSGRVVREARPDRYGIEFRALHEGGAEKIEGIVGSLARP
jgi:CheY-like chemotaxis protein